MKKIRSISLSKELDNKLTDDSQLRGLTISANLSRILYDYFTSGTDATARFTHQLKIKDLKSSNS